MTACASLPKDIPRVPSCAVEIRDETRIGKTVALEAEKHPGESGFYILPSDIDAFIARAVLIEAAERTLDLQYYIVNDNLTVSLRGSDFLNRLVAGNISSNWAKGFVVYDLPDLIWKTEEEGKEVEYTHDPVTSIWRRLSVKFMSISCSRITSLAERLFPEYAMGMNIPCDAVSSLNNCFALTKMVANDIPYELLLSAARGGLFYSDTGRSIYEDVDFPMTLQEQDR